MEPVPASLHPYLFSEACAAWEDLRSRWFAKHKDQRSDDQFWERVSLSTAWENGRSLETYYLSPHANIRMWSDAACVSIAWDNRGKEIRGIPAWSATRGIYRLPRDVFAQEIRSFHERLMAAMDERVRRVLDGGLPGTISRVQQPISFDLPHNLAAAHFKQLEVLELPAIRETLPPLLIDERAKHVAAHQHDSLTV